MLRYTHITEDAGTGPFEIDPHVNASTGISTFTQSIYNSPTAGVWQFDHSQPVAQTGTFTSLSALLGCVLAPPSFGLFDGADGEGFQFGDEFA